MNIPAPTVHLDQEINDRGVALDMELVNARPDHDQLRVLVMVQADGHYTDDGSVRLSFKKLRKVERCKRLLRAADIPFVLRTYEDTGVSVITVNSRDIPLWLRLFRNKTFGSWLFDESPDVFFDELAYWDG